MRKINILFPTRMYKEKYYFRSTKIAGIKFQRDRTKDVQIKFKIYTERHTNLLILRIHF